MLKGSAMVGSISICKQRKTAIDKSVNKPIHTKYNGKEKAM
jgi:hypothetical protein